MNSQNAENAIAFLSELIQGIRFNQIAGLAVAVTHVPGSVNANSSLITMMQPGGMAESMQLLGGISCVQQEWTNHLCKQRISRSGEEPQTEPSTNEPIDISEVSLENSMGYKFIELKNVKITSYPAVIFATQADHPNGFIYKGDRGNRGDYLLIIIPLLDIPPRWRVVSKTDFEFLTSFSM
jgi:ABC-type glutathione transport system ATPase component